MEIVKPYQKFRKDFGKYPMFEDKDAEVLVDMRPDEQLLAEYIVKNPISIGVQCAPDMSDCDLAFTDRIEQSHTGILHLEGGWPKDIDPTDADQKGRYCKKVQRDEDYVRTVLSMCSTVDNCVKQNIAVDIYEEYFAGSYIDHSSEPPSAKTLTVFKDPSESKRTATHISWFPTDGRKLAVAYCILQFQQMPEGVNVNSHIWDINNPNFPEMDLTPASPLVCLEYSPKDPNLLVGGSYNGLISYWDTRRGSMPAETSQIEKSHRDPVYDVKWLQSKTGYECLSVSTDGQALIWDVRKREPMEVLVLEPKNEVFNGVLGGVSLDYDVNTGGPTKFMIGTEQGIVLNCNRKIKNPQERITHTFVGHHGPIYAVQRNPANFKFFLTIGDWTARIWSDEVQTGPIITTKYHSSYLTGGCWSPTRPGVFFTTKMDGFLDVWDYMYKQNNAVFTVQVSDSGAHSLRVHSDGKLVAVGSMDGSVNLLELSDGLSERQPNEKEAVGQMFEREQKREKNLQMTAKERAQKQKKAKHKETEEDKTMSSVDQQTLNELSDEFFKAVGTTPQKLETGVEKVKENGSEEVRGEEENNVASE